MGGSKLPVPFGNPATYAGHSGIDFAGHAGEPIPASGPGRVVSRGRNDRGGFYIWIQYDAGPLVGYHHMNSHDGCPALRARVTLGQRLGYVGWAGHVVPAGRAGAHLHSEVSGNATTDGYWKFFDRNRVVGQGAAAGGGSSKEDDVSAEEVWNTKVTRGGQKVSALQELADAKSAALATEQALAPIIRSGAPVSVRQEIADAKTNTIYILAEVKALSAAVQALAVAKGADPAAILKAVQDGVEKAMRKVTVTVDVDG